VWKIFFASWIDIYFTFLLFYQKIISPLAQAKMGRSTLPPLVILHNKPLQGKQAFRLCAYQRLLGRYVQIK